MKSRIVYGPGVSETIGQDVVEKLPDLLEKAAPANFNGGILTLPTENGTILAQRKKVAQDEFAWFVGTEDTGMDWIDRPTVEVSVSDEAELLGEEILSELVGQTISSAGVGKPGRVAIHKSYDTPNGQFDTFMIIKPNLFSVYVGTPQQIKQMADVLAKQVEKSGGELTTWKSPKTKALLRKQKRLEKKHK